MQQVIHLKGLAVILYFHANAIRQFVDDHFHPAGLGMAAHIGERLLGDAKEHRSFCHVQPLHCRKGRQIGADARPFGKALHKRMQGGNQSQIIQQRRAQFAGELMHFFNRFLHHLLRARDFLLEALGAARGLPRQSRQLDVDAH